MNFKDPEKRSRVELKASFVSDEFSIIQTGIEYEPTYLGLSNIILSFDTERNKLWKACQVILYGANTCNREQSLKLNSNFQVATKIEAGDLTHLHETWNKPLRMKM